MCLRFHHAIPSFLAARGGESQARRGLLAAAIVGALLAGPIVGALLAEGPEPVEWAPPGLAAQTAARSTTDKVKAERYVIDIRFEPEKAWLAAKATVTLRALEAVENIEFELNPRLEIEEITDAQGRKLEFNRSGRIGSPRLLVRLAEPAKAGDEITMTWAYEGAPRLTGLDYITKDGILLRDEARWYPTADLAAFTQNRINVGVPTGWQVVSSGRSPHSIGAGLSATFTWVTTGAVSSRSLAAFPVVREECSEWFKKQINAKPSPDHFIGYCPSAVAREGARAVASRIEGLLTFLEKSVGHGGGNARYFQFAIGFPEQRGTIGYSAPRFLVVSEDVVKYAADPNYQPEFLPHEIAHQWFPIEVTLARPEDGWLAESLAEYLAWRYLQEKQPEAARAMVAKAMRDSLALETLPPLSQGLRMFALHDWDATYAALYQRGMLVWRTLETVIGRQRVDAALREYYQRHRGGSASVADFRAICEEISGRDLKWFFDYYLDGTAIPELEIRRVPGAAPNEYTGEIIVKNVPAEFTTRVEMKLTTAEGVVEHSVATRGEVTPFTVNVGGTVTRVEVDPGSRILRWTEAAHLSRAQREWMMQAGDAEEAGDLAKATELAAQALAADPGDIAHNAQLIHFSMGRLYARQSMWVKAAESLRRALQARSIDPGADAFYRAWSHVLLARIARRQGRTTEARKEAAEGLKLPAYSLDTPVLWPGDAREQSAREALQALARVAPPAKRR